MRMKTIGWGLLAVASVWGAGVVQGQTTATRPTATRPASRPAVVVAKKKSTPPMAVVLTGAMSKVGETYKDQLAAAKSPEERGGLAKILMLAAGAESDTAGKYALLTKARDLALEGGDIERAAGAIELLDEEFTIDVFKMGEEAMLVRIKVENTPAQAKAMMNVAIKFAGKALLVEKFDLAKKFTAMATACAKPLNDDAANQTVATMVQLVKETEGLVPDFKLAMGAINAKPKDPDANMRAGIFRAFYKGDWKMGLSNLALGSDAKIADLAKKEIAGAADADEQVGIADGWWEIGQGTTSVTKGHILQHATGIYWAALPQLEGPTKERVEQRLGIVPPKVVKEVEDFALVFLRKLPKNLLPVTADDFKALLQKQSGVRAWMQRAAFPNKTPTVTTCDFGGCKTLPVAVPSGDGTKLIYQTQMTIVFNEVVEFEGMKCEVTIRIAKTVPNDSPDLASIKTMVKGKSYVLGTIVSDVAVTMGPPKEGEESPRIFLTVMANEGEYTAVEK